jgi:hypothetical protein
MVAQVAGWGGVTGLAWCPSLTLFYADRMIKILTPLRSLTIRLLL